MSEKLSIERILMMSAEELARRAREATAKAKDFESPRMGKPGTNLDLCDRLIEARA